MESECILLRSFASGVSWNVYGVASPLASSVQQENTPNAPLMQDLTAVASAAAKALLFEPSSTRNIRHIER